MEKKKPGHQYLKVATITVVSALVIMGIIFGLIYERDRIALDIQKLKISLNIANALNSKVAYGEGYIIINRTENREGSKIGIPTLKSVEIKEKTIQVNFQSMIFSDSIEIKK